jgi:phage tail P2-like protein
MIDSSVLSALFATIASETAPETPIENSPEIGGGGGDPINCQIPANESQRLKAISIAIREEFARIFALTEAIKLIASPLTCPAAFLPAHAKNLRPAIWDDALTEHQKRRLLVSAPLIRLRAGTLGVVLRALESFGLNAHIERWDSFAGEPSTFRVVIDTIGSDYGDDAIHRLERIIKAAKRLSSHLIDIQVQATIEALLIYEGALTHLYEKIEISE